MSDKDNKKDSMRELPISLQGIEKILIYLNENNQGPLSIRNISGGSGLSMRVVKNILLQLERFNQIERVTEKNNILPKWKITKFGKKVIKEAKGMETKIKFPNKKEELIYGIVIPENIEKLKELSKANQEESASKLSDLQIELSKMLGPVLNINNPVFEDLMSFIIKRIKFLKQKVLNLPADPIGAYKLRKKGEKEKKVTKEEEKLLFVEIFFLNSLIMNEMKLINDFNSKLSQFLENKAFANGFSLAKDIREEIRTLTSLVSNRGSVNVNSHIISQDNLKQLSKNEVNVGVLDEIIDIPLTDVELLKAAKELILRLLAKINKGEKRFNGYSTELSDNIPLYALYQLILDEKPELNITIDQLEKVINSLADEGYIPGIKIIQEDEDHYLKVVQFKAHDMAQDEIELIYHAQSLNVFTLGDIIESIGWSTEKVLEILNNLTKLGILKYSKSFLHGERWYIISENNS